ncbi:MAG: hypothetical protein CL596_08100 [Alteromonas sp.]|nr:hypothetical protein [Alteromonas sp.]MAY22252.1 hypothetical protein [Flavobacteriaceae bacterium]
MKTQLQFEFGTLEVHDSYVIAIMKEGVTISPGHNKVLVKIAEDYFPHKKFGYISHRINSYSVDPTVYTNTSKIENLVAFAVVSENPLNLSNAHIEKLFLKKPFRNFKKLRKAIDWVMESIEEES